MTQRRMLLATLISIVGCGSPIPTPAEPDLVPSTKETTAAVSESLPTLPENAPELVPEEGFELLSLDSFEQFFAKKPSTAVWEAVGNGFNCSGKPRGYLYSKQPYGNMTLRLDYRFRRPANLVDEASFKGNTGVMLFISGEHKQWPVSLEVQGKYSEMGMIKANGGAANVEIDDNPEARLSARKPVGEWNRLEVVTKDGTVTALVNGTKVCDSKAGELKEGAIGIQAEDFEVQFRNLQVRRD